MTQMRRCRTRGFTFVELMLTVLLLGILATVAVPMVQLAHQRQREEALSDALRDIRRAIDGYRRAVDQGRIMKKEGESGFPPSLAVLADGVINAQDPAAKRIYFLRRIPRDPMATDPNLSAEETWSLRSYDSPPDAPREGDDVFDIASRADGVGLNGIPYKQW